MRWAAPEVVKVVGTFVEEINNRVRVATAVGSVDGQGARIGSKASNFNS